MGSSTHAVSIHIFDDDSLLNIFYLYRLYLFDEDDDTLGDNARIFEGQGNGSHVDDGGVSPRMFAKDGIISYLVRRSTGCLPRLHQWHARRHDGTFTSPSTYHRLL